MSAAAANAAAPLIVPHVKRANATDLAMEALLDLVRRCVLKPGDRVPSQRELVRQMGLSHTVIREALRGLASTGVIEVHPGRGAFVRSVSPEMLIHPESLFFILQREALLQAIEVGKILEVAAIGLAAERATNDELQELERILKQIEEGVHSEERPLRYAPLFHFRIAKAAHNQVLGNMVKSFVRLLQRGAEVIAERVPEAKEREYRMHAELYEPIRRRDPEEARRRMRKHLEEAEKGSLRLEISKTEFEASAGTGPGPRVSFGRWRVMMICITNRASTLSRVGVWSMRRGGKDATAITLAYNPWIDALDRIGGGSSRVAGAGGGRDRGNNT